MLAEGKWVEEGRDRIPMKTLQLPSSSRMKGVISVPEPESNLEESVGFSPLSTPCFYFIHNCPCVIWVHNCPCVIWVLDTSGFLAQRSGNTVKADVWRPGSHLLQARGDDLRLYTPIHVKSLGEQGKEEGSPHKGFDILGPNLPDSHTVLMFLCPPFLHPFGTTRKISEESQTSSFMEGGGVW